MSGIPTGGEYMAGRRESVAELFARYDAAAFHDAHEDIMEEIEELPLSVEQERHVVILLGTGGPHDELDVNLNTEEVRYRYFWGSTSFDTHVSESDPLHRLAFHFSGLYEE